MWMKIIKNNFVFSSPLRSARSSSFTTLTSCHRRHRSTSTIDMDIAAPIERAAQKTTDEKKNRTKLHRFSNDNKALTHVLLERILDVQCERTFFGSARRGRLEGKKEEAQTHISRAWSSRSWQSTTTTRSKQLRKAKENIRKKKYTHDRVELNFCSAKERSSCSSLVIWPSILYNLSVRFSLLLVALLHSFITVFFWFWGKFNDWIWNCEISSISVTLMDCFVTENSGELNLLTMYELFLQLQWSSQLHDHQTSTTHLTRSEPTFPYGWVGWSENTTHSFCFPFYLTQNRAWILLQHNSFVFDRFRKHNIILFLNWRNIFFRRRV